MSTLRMGLVLDNHAAWLQDHNAGVRANLSGADLSVADLFGADLSNANLRNANLNNADLNSADLSYANLSNANLRSANLNNADLSYADLRGANLRNADLRNAGLSGAILPHHPIPDTGNFVCYKKVAKGVVLTLLVPATAARAYCVQSRKCRVEFARVIEGSDGGDAWLNAKIGDAKALTYRRGEVVRADGFDPDVRMECTQGIHVFATYEEAERYEL